MSEKDSIQYTSKVLDVVNNFLEASDELGGIPGGFANLSQEQIKRAALILTNRALPQKTTNRAVFEVDVSEFRSMGAEEILGYLWMPHWLKEKPGPVLAFIHNLPVPKTDIVIVEVFESDNVGKNLQEEYKRKGLAPVDIRTLFACSRSSSVIYGDAFSRESFCVQWYHPGTDSNYLASVNNTQETVFDGKEVRIAQIDRGVMSQRLHLGIRS